MPRTTGRIPVREQLALLFALAYPTLLTIVYFILLARQPTGIQQGVYAIGKLIQFGFPVLWVVWYRHHRPRWQAPRVRELAAGALLGGMLLATALAGYFLWLKPSGAFDEPATKILAKISGFGVGGGPRYAAVAVFYCVLHSLLEEYYWRWFTFGELRRVLGLTSASLLSAAGFMSHHVLVLAVYFGWTSPLTYLFSLAVAVGGLMWAWMYEKTGSLAGPWISHALVDAAIFVVGYDLLTASITS